MRHRNLDTAYLLEFVRQYALIERLFQYSTQAMPSWLRVIKLTTRGSGAPVRLADSISSRVWAVCSLSSM
jgi:hypothetical protein